jgi:hypothetical protein
LVGGFGPTLNRSKKYNIFFAAIQYVPSRSAPGPRD